MQKLFISLIGVSFTLWGCQVPVKDFKHDASINLNAQEFEQNLTQVPWDDNSFQPLSTTHVLPPVPVSPELGKPVSLAIIQEVPLKDVFLDLARQAGVNIVIDPGVQGGIHFTAKHKAFIDVVEEICHMAALRYKVVKNVVRIEPDRAYLKNYNLHYLSSKRENSSRISIATDVFTAVEGRSQELDNGSNNLLTETSKSDFWSELEQSIATILSHHTQTTGEQKEPKISIHRQAGIISVFASHAQHQQLQEYLDLLDQNIATQVIIEAKIVEINLKDEFKSGINWNSLKGNFLLRAPLGQVAVPGIFDKVATPPRDVFSIGGGNPNLSGLISLMQRFGTVRTLSSPRLTVMNNHSAVLKVATNQVFFRMNYDREFSGFQNDREHIHASSEVQTVPIGLVMVVHPSINTQKGNIVMTLRPTISRVVEEKEDPAVAILSKQSHRSLIPQVQVREFDSVINMKSGEVIVLGGLMEERSDNENAKVPALGDVPFLGNLFSGTSKERSVTELVVFLKATIINSSGQTVIPQQVAPVTRADQNIYQKFTKDPRPLVFE